MSAVYHVLICPAGSTGWRGWATTAAASGPNTSWGRPAAPARISCRSLTSKVSTGRHHSHSHIRKRQDDKDGNQRHIINFLDYLPLSNMKGRLLFPYILNFPCSHTLTLSSEKGILKKPGPPYCGLDRLSSSSQNNLVNLTDRRDRPEISDVERTLKSLNGYHEDILEVRADRPDKLPTSQEMTVNLIWPPNTVERIITRYNGGIHLGHNDWINKNLLLFSLQSKHHIQMAIWN